MDTLVQELLDAANEVVSNLMHQYHDSRAVPDYIVRLCAAMTKVEEKTKTIDESIQDGDYIISTEGLPLKLHITVEGNKATYIDGSIGDVRDLYKWTFEQVEPIEAYEVDPETTTCYNCENKDICKYAFDPYNTEGDCLANK